MNDVLTCKHCVGCTACYCVCPTHAITMGEDEYGFICAKVNMDICVQCGQCKRVCMNSDVSTEKFSPIMAFSAYNMDLAIRMDSSSGGVFSAFAKSFVERQGVVIGAVFDQKNEVHHVLAKSNIDISAMRGSKYIQSDIENIFVQTLNLLKAGVMVLFSGTPCQVAGLRRYLNDDYENLLTIDFICHGVSSRAVWRQYIRSVVKKGNSQVSEINFRDKETGWNRFSFSYKKNGRKHTSLFIDNPFCFFYDKHYILGEHCFHCIHSNGHHMSDITLSDFWGINNFPDHYNDNCGSSLIFVNTKMGNEQLHSCSAINLKQIDPDSALSNNLHAAPERPEMFGSFWHDYLSCGISKCIKRYFYTTALKRYKVYAKNSLIKLKLIKYFIN